MKHLHGDLHHYSKKKLHLMLTLQSIAAFLQDGSVT